MRRPADMLFTLVPLLALGVTGAAQAALPFGPGEQLQYRISFMGVSMGHAKITVGWPTERASAQVWPLVCEGTTTSVAALFQIQDRFVSYFDPLTLRPVGHDYVMNQTGFRRKDRYAYDRVNGKVFGTRARPEEPVEEVALDVDPLAMDLAAAAFQLRTTPLSVGERRQLTIFTGSRTYVARVKVEGEETLATALGLVPARRLSISADFRGKAKTKGDLTVHVTADDRQLPVRAEAEFLLGNVRAELERYEPGMAGGRP